MKIGKMALIKMINETKWVKFQIGRGGRNIKIAADHVSVNFGSTSKLSDIVNRVTVNIGSDIVKKLNWSKGDKIIISHHPDNLMHFNLCKSDNGLGITLSKADNMNHYRVQFKWPYEKNKLQKETIWPVDYNIVSNQLLVFIVK